MDGIRPERHSKRGVGIGSKPQGEWLRMSVRCATVDFYFVFLLTKKWNQQKYVFISISIYMYIE